MKPSVTYFQDEAGEWRFRVQGANGEIVCTSEGYTRERDARRGYRAMRRIVMRIEE